VVFFQQAAGANISSEADLKEVLTSFLFRYNPEVEAVYTVDKDELWGWIEKANPNNRMKINQYLEQKRSFKIEDNYDQEVMFKELVVFSPNRCNSPING
jgi:hypothetical protein